MQQEVRAGRHLCRGTAGFHRSLWQGAALELNCERVAVLCRSSSGTELRGEWTAAGTGLGWWTWTGVRCWNPLTFRQLWPRLPADHLTLECHLLSGPRGRRSQKKREEPEGPYSCGAVSLGHSV